VKYVYYAIFEYSSEEEISKGVYPVGIYFPDFLGCVSGADNTEYGVEMAKEVLKLRIESDIEDKIILPNPVDKMDLEKKLAQNERLVEIIVEI